MESTLGKIIITAEEEYNEQYNPDKELNKDGNYHHPHYIFTFNGIEGGYLNTSCSDFLERYRVELGDINCYVCRDDFNKNNSYIETTFDSILHNDFIEAFEEEFGIRLPSTHNYLKSLFKIENVEEYSLKDNDSDGSTTETISGIFSYKPMKFIKTTESDNKVTYTLVYDGLFAVWTVTSKDYKGMTRNKVKILFSNIEPEKDKDGYPNKDSQLLTAMANTFKGHRWADIRIPFLEDYEVGLTKLNNSTDMKWDINS